MTAEELISEVKSLNRAEKEKFYYKVMDGFYDAMISNPKFMEEAFHCMTTYLSKMKGMGLDVNAILMEMESGLRLKQKAA